MFSQYLVRHFIKDYENTSSKNVRNAYGYLGGIIGVIINMSLFLLKLSVGVVSHSIAVTADAFNNLSDSASSLITILGFKLASKPADKEHPFGHGRIEYISALMVSFLVLFVGIKFVKSSFDRIINPEPVNFSITILVLMIICILCKIWSGKFNSYLGKAINSKALKASSTDAFADVITSSIVALSLVLSNFTSFPIDGYLGIVVALFIIFSGFSLIKETLDPLLGEAPDPELVDEIKKKLLSYNYISGVHDLIIHNYGPGRCMATIHAEVPIDASIVKVHEVIDRAEREISKDLSLVLVIHMDPVNTNCSEVKEAQDIINKILKNFPIVKSMHDFRVVGEGSVKNIVFDIVINSTSNLSHDDEDKLINDINDNLKNFYPEYTAIITIDKDFLGVN